MFSARHMWKHLPTKIILDALIHYIWSLNVSFPMTQFIAFVLWPVEWVKDGNMSNTSYIHVMNMALFEFLSTVCICINTYIDLILGPYTHACVEYAYKYDYLYIGKEPRKDMPSGHEYFMNIYCSNMSIVWNSIIHCKIRLNADGSTRLLYISDSRYLCTIIEVKY